MKNQATATGPDLHTPEIDTSFINLLQTHRGGGAAAELGAQLTELVKAVRTTGKGGVLTIAIGIKPASKGLGAVVIKDKITLRAPQEEAEESFRFTTDLGQLVKDDPRQKVLALKVVSGSPGYIDVTPARAANA